MKKVIEDWLRKVFKTIGDRVYRRLSGTRLFRKASLSRYRNAIIEKYNELYLPFRPKSRPLMMHDVYVPLRGALDDTQTEQIEVYTAISKFKRFIIKGAPGSGKSMFCKHVCLGHAKGWLSLPRDAVPVLIELNRLEDLQLSIKSIKEYLVNRFTELNFPHAENFIERFLDQGSLYLLLDGLDEVNSQARRRVARVLNDFLDRYSKCRCIITCRTAVYNGEFDRIANESIELVEFSDPQIGEFLRAWEPYMAHKKSIKQLLFTLRDRPRIKALVRNPLLLTIVAYLYTDIPSFRLPHSRAEFYNEAVKVLLRQWQEEFNIFEARDKDVILQHLALFNQDVASKGQGDRRHIDYQTIRKQISLVLPNVGLSGNDPDEILDEIVERSGLLLSLDGGQSYQFAHLTLQEYFAAKSLINDEQGIIERFQQNQDVWRESVKLWGEIVPDGTEFIKKLAGIEPVTAFECLADVKKISSEIAQGMVTTAQEFLLKHGLNAGDDFLQAFGIVASNLHRERGQKMFDFLVAQFQNNQTDRSIFLASAKALTFTNLPEAAEILIKNIDLDYTEIRSMIVKISDITLPILEDLAKNNQAVAFETLHEMRTPEAAKALVPLLWHTKDQVSVSAAWILADFLREPSIENTLRTYNKLTEKQRKAKRNDWLWKPFQEQKDPNLPIITGRIAHLLSTHTVEPYKKPEAIDIRLSVPLYTLGQKFLPIGHRKSFLKLMPASCQKSLRYIEKKKRAVTQNDWVNYFRPSEYDFENGWHYRMVQIISIIFSWMAIYQLGNLLWQSQSFFSRLNAVIIFALISIGFSIFLLLRRVSNEEFIEDFLLGPVKILFVWFRKWPIIIGIFLGVIIGGSISLAPAINSIKINISNAGGFSMNIGFLISLFMGIVVGIFLWAGLRKDLIALIRALIGTLIIGFVTLVIIITMRLLGYPISVTMPSCQLGWWIPLSLMVGAIGGLFLTEKPYAIIKTTLLGTWWPFVGYFTTIFLFNFLSKGIVFLIWISIIAFCCLLWMIGRKRHNDVENPLNGILEQQGVTQRNWATSSEV